MMAQCKMYGSVRELDRYGGSIVNSVSWNIVDPRSVYEVADEIGVHRQEALEISVNVLVVLERQESPSLKCMANIPIMQYPDPDSHSIVIPFTFIPSVNPRVRPPDIPKPAKSPQE